MAIRTTSARMRAPATRHGSHGRCRSPLPRDQLPVPPKNRVRGHERRDSAQQPAAQAMAEFRETPTLLVIEPQPLPLKTDLQHTILFA